MPNVTSTCSVLAVGSKITVVWPVPGDPVGGISAAPVRVAVNVIGIACADADSIRTAAKTNTNGINLISPPSIVLISDRKIVG
jgi:hypothetical protein